jgi:drug/metabolite transporter (DMT)-like permease
VHELQERPLIALGVWTYLGVLATAGAYAAWTVLAASLPLARAALVLYLVPVLALGLGWALLGEAPGMLGLAGVACILGGVVIARRTAA